MAPETAAAAPTEATPRVLVLAGAHSYRLEAFQLAANRLGVSVVRGIDAPPAHASAGLSFLRLDFRDPGRATRQVLKASRAHPFQAVIPTDDATVTLAARLAMALELPHNSLEAAEATRSKYVMRQRLAQARLPSPWFGLFSTMADPRVIAQAVPYPCVLKPTCLSGSRGVIRANDPEQFVDAFTVIQGLLSTIGLSEVLVEGYIPGQEFAVEGLLRQGQMTLLAIFDKPDPLEGPFFEETIYITPSRTPAQIQSAIAECVAQAAQALGLSEGAVHGEVRVNDRGVWLVEVAARSIGGLCGQTLRFAHSADVSLEELILRQALGWPIETTAREQLAGGVMMLPIPARGTLTSWSGLEAAQAIPGIESVEITARQNYPLEPLPVGESYLGFIFARGDTPHDVEAALRAAQRCLHFEIEAPLTVLSG